MDCVMPIRDSSGGFSDPGDQYRRGWIRDGKNMQTSIVTGPTGDIANVAANHALFELVAVIIVVKKYRSCWVCDIEERYTVSRRVGRKNTDTGDVSFRPNVTILVAGATKWFVLADEADVLC